MKIYFKFNFHFCCGENGKSVRNDRKWPSAIQIEGKLKINKYCQIYSSSNI